MTETLERAAMTAQAINDLPDEDFAFIEDGGSKDEHGRTVPRSLRHFPIHDAAHVRNALARAPQSPFGDKAMPKIVKAAKKMGIGDYADESRSEDYDEDDAVRGHWKHGWKWVGGGKPPGHADVVDRIRNSKTLDEAHQHASDLRHEHLTAALREHGQHTSGSYTEMQHRLVDAVHPRLRVEHNIRNARTLKDAQAAARELRGEQLTAALRERHLETSGSFTEMQHRLVDAIGFNHMGRSEEPLSSDILRYDRSWALDDIIVRSGGDGRTVEAYAAVFDTPSEIKDQHGHYMETIHRSAFNRAISHGINRINVFYNHGLTVHGNADALGSVPIGSPVDIQPDGRGLRTVTRFNRSTLADSVLEAIRAGDIRGYSFRGRIFQSNPSRVPTRRSNGPLPTITRTELGLAEYGPTPTPAYAEAGIVAVRSLEQVASTLAALDADERAELMRMLAVSTPIDPETEPATPVVGPGAEDSPVDGRSGRQIRFQQFREELRKRGVL